MTKPRKPPLPMPRFETEAEESDFWATHDTTPYGDWSQARVVKFENVVSDHHPISIRVPSYMLNELKALAAEAGVGYQALMKWFLMERLSAEKARRAGQNVDDTMRYLRGDKIAPDFAAVRERPTAKARKARKSREK